MSITQTVEIPASHRLTLDVPREVPAGPVVLTFSPTVSPKKHCSPPLDMRKARNTLLRNIGRTGDSSRKYAGSLKDMDIFKGDPVEIQRKMRDEW